MLTLVMFAALAAKDAAKTIVTEKSHGKAVPVVVGRTIEVRLRCRPGTGFAWHPVAVDEGVLVELEPSRFVAPPGDDGQPREGGAAIQVFAYRVAMPGKTTFRAVYRRGRTEVPHAEFAVTLEAK